MAVVDVVAEHQHEVEREFLAATTTICARDFVLRLVAAAGIADDREAVPSRLVRATRARQGRAQFLHVESGFANRVGGKAALVNGMRSSWQGQKCDSDNSKLQTPNSKENLF